MNISIPPIPPKTEIVIASGIEFSQNRLPDQVDMESDLTKAQHAIDFLESDETQKELNKFSPPHSPQLEKKTPSPEETNKSKKIASFLHACEALKGMTNFSQDGAIPELEKNIQDYTQLKKQSIEQQREINGSMKSILEKLEKLQNVPVGIATLNESMNSYSARIDNCEQKFNELKQDLTNTQKNVSNLNSNFNNLITQQNQDIKNLQTITKTLENMLELNTQSHVTTSQQTETNKNAYVALSHRVESLQNTNQSLLRKVQIYMTGSVAILMVSIYIWWHSYHR